MASRPRFLRPAFLLNKVGQFSQSSSACCKSYFTEGEQRCRHCVRDFFLPCIPMRSCIIVPPWGTNFIRSPYPLGSTHGGQRAMDVTNHLVAGFEQAGLLNDSAESRGRRRAIHEGLHQLRP